MSTSLIKETLMQIVLSHYELDALEFEDRYINKNVKSLDVDSIAMLEFFLVIEDGFNLDKRLPDVIDMEKMSDKTVHEFLDEIARQVDKMTPETFMS